MAQMIATMPGRPGAEIVGVQRRPVDASIRRWARQISHAGVTHLGLALHQAAREAEDA